MVFYYELKKSLLGRDSVPEHSINEWIDYNKTSQRVFGILIMSALLGYIYYCVIAVLANMPEILPVMDPWEVAKYSLENGYFGSPEGY